VDKILADRVVALGVGEAIHVTYRSGEKFDGYCICRDDAHEEQTAEQFTEDWRVAGALMEKCADKDPDGLELYIEQKRDFVLQVWQGGPSTRIPIGDSLPRAIIEACVGALDDPV